MNNRIVARLSLILFSLLIISTTLANANSITFSDLGLSSNTIDVYSRDSGTGQWISNGNITSNSTFYYDPLTDYNFVIRPTPQNTYFSSPTGLLRFFIDNGASLLAILIFGVMVIAFILAVVKGVIR